VTSAGSHHVHFDDNRVTRGVFVPAGTTAIAYLDAPIDTQSGRPGTRFTAHVETALRAASGAIVVSPSARVYGRIEGVGDPDDRRLTLAFDAIDTVAGPAPLHAALAGAHHEDFAGEPRVRYQWIGFNAPVRDGHYGSRPPYWLDHSQYATYRFADSGWGEVPYWPREIRLPERSALRLVLTRPVVLSPSVVR
jgi:hypothetical protein